MNLYGNITKLELRDIKPLYLLRSIYGSKVHIDHENKLGPKDPNVIVRYIEGFISEAELREKIGNEEYDKYFFKISYFQKGNELKILPETKPEAEKRYYEADSSKPDLPYWFYK